MAQSADFSEVDSCDNLADFIAVAANLRELDVSGHRGREISVMVECA